MSVMLFARKIKTLTPAEAWEAHQRNDLVLVDVRERPEWRSGVVSGALRIPLHELSRRIEELPRENMVAFICRSGHRRPPGAATRHRCGEHQRRHDRLEHRRPAHLDSDAQRQIAGLTVP
jgi:Rhodanese-like domain